MHFGSETFVVHKKPCCVGRVEKRVELVEVCRRIVFVKYSPTHTACFRSFILRGRIYVQRKQ